jgi:hypothetical protein
MLEHSCTCTIIKNDVFVGHTHTPTHTVGRAHTDTHLVRKTRSETPSEPKHTHTHTSCNTFILRIAIPTIIPKRLSSQRPIKPEPRLPLNR